MPKEVLEKADYKVARAGIVGGPILGFFAVPQLGCFGQRQTFHGSNFSRVGS